VRRNDDQPESFLLVPKNDFKLNPSGQLHQQQATELRSAHPLDAEDNRHYPKR
jgi:hypothetical protein